MPRAQGSEALLALAARFGLPAAGIAVRLWDGSSVGPRDDPVAALVVRSPRALGHALAAPGELGLARAFVSGELEVEGDLEALFRAVRLPPAGRSRPTPRELLRALLAARAAGALRRLPKPPAIEVRLSGRLHSRARDAAAISHHYDVPEAFYRLVLGPSMTYSCAYFRQPELDLAAAQDAKHDLILRKLGASAGTRLLDVGCGWGSLALRAGAAGARVVGVTLSAEQARVASRRVADAGLEDLVEIRVQDYRDVHDGPFDAIASVGMVEHVGRANLTAYYERLRALLRPGGRLLNHGITRAHGGRPGGRRSFIHRYVFPDGELHELLDGVRSMEGAGFEIRDVESLREHYARTLRCWVANLEESFGEAQRLAGAERARTWRLYMAGSADAFTGGAIGIHQILGIVPDEEGASGMPPTRAGWP